MLSCNAWSSNFWVCGWNLLVQRFKWKLLSSTFTWFYLFCYYLITWNFEFLFNMLIGGTLWVKVKLKNPIANCLVFSRLAAVQKAVVLPELLRNLNVEETKLKLVVRTEKKNFILAVNLCDKTVSFFFFFSFKCFHIPPTTENKDAWLKVVLCTEFVLWARIIWCCLSGSKDHV